MLNGCCLQSILILNIWRLHIFPRDLLQPFINFPYERVLWCLLSISIKINTKNEYFSRDIDWHHAYVEAVLKNLKSYTICVFLFFFLSFLFLFLGLHCFRFVLSYFVLWKWFLLRVYCGSGLHQLPSVHWTTISPERVVGTYFPLQSAERMEK